MRALKLLKLAMLTGIVAFTFTLGAKQAHAILVQGSFGATVTEACGGVVR